MSSVENPEIADRLDAFAMLLELGEANPYTVRAYRRAAEAIRGAALPVGELVRSGRARELRGIGRGIEARLRELVETGEIAELATLEREPVSISMPKTSGPTMPPKSSGAAHSSSTAIKCRPPGMRCR